MLLLPILHFWLFKKSTTLVAKSALLNRSPIPSLDTFFCELLREEQCLLTQGSMTRDPALYEYAPVAYVAHYKIKGHDMRQVQWLSCKIFGHIACNCHKKFCNYASNRVISLLIVPHVLHD